MSCPRVGRDKVVAEKQRLTYPLRSLCQHPFEIDEVDASQCELLNVLAGLAPGKGLKRAEWSRAQMRSAGGIRVLVVSKKGWKGRWWEQVLEEISHNREEREMQEESRAEYGREGTWRKASMSQIAGKESEVFRKWQKTASNLKNLRELEEYRERRKRQRVQRQDELAEQQDRMWVLQQRQDHPGSRMRGAKPEGGYKLGLRRQAK